MELVVEISIAQESKQLLQDVQIEQDSQTRVNHMELVVEISTAHESKQLHGLIAWQVILWAADCGDSGVRHSGVP